MLLSIYTLSALVAVVCAQQYTTPVPILRQINKHNEDGSYSYGYEGADGAFKIETKYPNGEVYGKYGYVDDTGKLREVEYGATKLGFQPTGTGITVAPPTLNNNYVDDGDDGQYREDPSVYWKNDQYNSKPARKQSNNAATFSNFNLPASGRAQVATPAPYHAPAAPAFHHQPAPAPAPVHHYQPSSSSDDGQYREDPSIYWKNDNYNSKSSHHAPSVRADPNQFHGHPASNIDILSGSYTINYSG